MFLKKSTNHDLFGLWGNDFFLLISSKKYRQKKSSSFRRFGNKFVVISFFGPNYWRVYIQLIALISDLELFFFFFSPNTYSTAWKEKKNLWKLERSNFPNVYFIFRKKNLEKKGVM
jgi:hypothetical protein